MMTKLISANKAVCSLILALCLFAACEEPPASYDDEYKNPNAGELAFSHDSGLYAVPFSLSITAAESSEIYYSTDGSIPSPGKAGTVKYSAAINVVNRNGQANVLATEANITQMNMVQDDERGSIPTFYLPNKDQVPKATVIRAIAVTGGKQSGVVTKTYFIGNNLAQYGNVRIISLVSDPYNLVDTEYGIMVRGDAGNRWESPPGTDVYNFRQKGEDWERPAYLELFEGNASSRSVALSTGVGIRVRGGYSRGPGQKSFNVYFKEQYGIKNLKNYNLIPGAVKVDGKTPVETYKSVMLRTGANDSEYTKFYDVFLQELLNDRSFTTQAGVPCVVYLNGEYWGPYNLQERYSDNHTEYKYGVDKDNVISYDNGELDDGNAGEESIFPTLAEGVIAGTTTYQQFCDKFDIDNFIDYWAAEIYIYNEDWPQNNYRIWRTRAVESNNPYGDTKWRYQMFDTEYAMGIYSDGSLTGQGGKNAFEKILNGEHSNHLNNRLFAKLITEAEFNKKFVNTMMDLYNVNFAPAFFEPKLTYYADLYRPLMGDASTPGTYDSRWGPSGWKSYQQWVDLARSYLTNIRSAMVNNYLPTYFDGYSGIADINVSSGSLCNVTLAIAGASGASIKVNTVTPNLSSGSWMGQYYTVIPITVTASAPAGYEFESWVVTGGTPTASTTVTTTVTLSDANATITAKYKSTVVAVTGLTLNPTSRTLKIGETFNINATVAPNNATYKTVYWASSNTNVASVDHNGKVTAISDGTAIITASTLEATYTLPTCTVTVTAPQVLFDLGAKIQTATVGAINDFDNTFGNLIKSQYGSTYTIINGGGTKKLQVVETVMWGSGFDITPNLTFQAGDVIYVKGTHLSGSASDGIQIQKEWVDPWSTFTRWNIAPGQNFEGTFTLSAGDAAWFNSNMARVDDDGNATGVAMQLKTNGKDPWNAEYPNGETGNFTVEEFKITGYRD